MILYDRSNGEEEPRSPTPPLSPAPRSVPPKKHKRIRNTPAKGKADKNQDDIDAVGKAIINYFEERKKILKHENVQADADAAFCMSLQPLLKKLPLQKNLEAKIQIMTVIKNMTGSSQEDRSVPTVTSTPQASQIQVISTTTWPTGISQCLTYSQAGGQTTGQAASNVPMPPVKNWRTISEDDGKSYFNL